MHTFPCYTQSNKTSLVAITDCKLIGIPRRYVNIYIHMRAGAGAGVGVHTDVYIHLCTLTQTRIHSIHKLQAIGLSAGMLRFKVLVHIYVLILVYIY